MSIIKKSLVLTKEGYFSKHLEIINPLLPNPLSSKEIEVLSYFLALPGGEIAKRDRFSFSFREIVRKELKMSYASLYNHLHNLKKKGALIENEEGNLTPQPILIPDDNSQGYMIKITMAKEKKQDGNR